MMLQKNLGTARVVGTQQQHVLLPARPVVCRAHSAHSAGASGARHQPATAQPAFVPRDVSARFQGSRDIESITKLSSFNDEKTTRQGPVVVAFDNTAEAGRAVKWCLNNLLCPEEEGEKLELVHVVCDPQGVYRTAVGSSAAGRVQTVNESLVPEAYATFQKYIARLLDTARQSVEERCGEMLGKSGVQHEVHLPMLPCPRSASVIGETLLQEADRLGARALVVASHGPGAMSEYGSVARYCYQHASMPLVLIPAADPNYFGLQSFDIGQPAGAGASMDISQILQQQDAGVSHDLPATQAHVRPHLDSADDLARAIQSAEKAAKAAASQHSRGAKEVMLVVTHLPELEAHWQWVADNLCRHGDVLKIWHLHMSAPSGPAMQESGSLATLPTALSQVLKARGLADVTYTQHFLPDGNMSEAAKKVVAAVEGDTGVRMVCLLNYSRQGYMMESLRGSVASDLARHCPVPLVLLQPAA